MGGAARKGSTKKLETLLKSADIETCMAQICELYELDHVAYHLGVKDVDGVETPYLKTNYPADWVGHYLVKNYLQIDPVAVAGYDRTEPTSWSELDWSSSAATAFAIDAASFGIGQSGLVVPIIDKYQRRAMANFSNNLEPKAWADRLMEIQDDLVECAYILHGEALLELYPNRDDGPALSPRELECLKMASDGLEASEIAREIGLSDHTVRDYLKSARGKLSCTNIAQAMHKATVLRLI